MSYAAHTGRMNVQGELQKYVHSCCSSLRRTVPIFTCQDTGKTSENCRYDRRAEGSESKQDLPNPKPESYPLRQEAQLTFGIQFIRAPPDLTHITDPKIRFHGAGSQL